jgi:hypothetical protein
LLVGGDFNSSVPGVSVGIAKLTATGAPDATFAVASASQPLYALAVDDTGRILAGGAFGAYGGNDRPGLARLSAAGVHDSAFVPQLLLQHWPRMLLPLRESSSSAATTGCI